MVTLFSDRIPLAMLFEIVWKRQSEILNLWRPKATEPTAWPDRYLRRSASVTGLAPRIDVRSRRLERSHDGRNLTRLRHIWYRNAVELDARYGAYYFVRSGEWVEPRCADPSCAMCRNRPERHLNPRPPQAVPRWLAQGSDAPVKALQVMR